MARVRQQGTAAELIAGSILRGLGASYRLNVRSLPGSPDFANQSRKWAVFVHGCFWHHHTGCIRATIPKTNEAFWHQKFGMNRKRDARAIRDLRKAGFRVAVVWECHISDPASLSAKLSRVLETSRIDVRQTVDH